MKKIYKYITIAGPKGKPRIYTVFNNKSGGILGYIDYYKPWRQYVFRSEFSAVFNNTRLRDIIDFIENHAGEE